MGRARYVKTDFFTDEVMQDLEIAHPELRPMLTYQALWSIADPEGRFELRPRNFALICLPFVPYDREAAIRVLVEAKRVVLYTAEGKTYGWIPKFKKHQRVTGKEASAGARCPPPPTQQSTGDASGKQPGNNGEAPGCFTDAQEYGVRS